MNFLLRTAQPTILDSSGVPELPKDTSAAPKRPNTLEGLIAEDPFPTPSTSDDGNGFGVASGNAEGLNEKAHVEIENHRDVTEEEGWITIPSRELPEDWADAHEISSFRSLHRSFIFPGEQLHILVCLSASKQDTVEIVTPFRVAALMNKNGLFAPGTKGNAPHSEIVKGEVNGTHKENGANQSSEVNGETTLATEEHNNKEENVPTGETLLKRESHKRRTEILLERFRNSHFFVRVAGSDEPLWCKKNISESFSVGSDRVGEKISGNDSGPKKNQKRGNLLSAVIERGDFDRNASGGVARNTVKCCSLPNGDIVVLLQVNIGTEIAEDPVLEVLQFEKYHTSNETHNSVDERNHDDPYGELLKWLLPLDCPVVPPVRPLSPPSLSSNLLAGSPSQRQGASSSGSQLFSFGHFRSYSMNSLPQATTAPAPAPPPPNPQQSFELEDWDRFSPQKTLKGQDVGNEGILSFRGVSLETQRFSVHCGLEGLYIPGRRWRRKLEIIQPVEIQSFVADCNTEDLICVQIKNVAPARTPDIIIFVDAINIIFEETSTGRPPITLPVACIEAGNDHRLPNLALRTGEQHSFILKPAPLVGKDSNAQGERTSRKPFPQGTITSLHRRMGSKSGEIRRDVANVDQYSVLVSCRCSCTDSRLFFKHPISWQPRVARDLLISVASEMSERTLGTSGASQLPVQVLTLQASNLTSEDLTLTVLAPASFTSPPSVISLNSAPSTPMGASDLKDWEQEISSLSRYDTVPLVSVKQKESDGGNRSLSLREPIIPTSDCIANTSLSCTHLWLQSTIPLGYVPSQSTATVRLELLPLTDGIITLDTLQVAVKEKGITYIPEQSLKIYSTSSIATGIS
ncbi:uncharacterized protein LOC18422398 [Amborella trichopoda]|nr:uncharacterized protein LOC18422398 [Amborella trichopoda]XP_020521355.1 uncharacterized protein LOC18422398 [Amborella trichopoda]XP_020521359.1 uncharacterized protein LOC18422398 [Amborella trichopoda]|eukprot:XP_006827133.2 uncharacterized protein LOC18422398 [Amborella trichopoda]